MRLTLRTMLAYLDDVLDPGEAQQIGKKISEAETASNLVHRIREAVGRPSLGAPKVAGRAVDANTVAEYLDNTLPADRVVDFERICLMDENDVYLAEVASCHQILAEVLGDAAEVDPRSRARMYGLLAEHDARLEEAKAQAAKAKSGGHNGNSGKGNSGKAAAAAAAATAGDSAADTTPAKKKREVPEYLRENDGRGGIWRAAAVLLLGLLLAVVAVMAIGPEWLSDYLGRRTEVASNQNVPAGAAQGANQPAVPQNPGDPAASPRPAEQTPATPAESVASPSIAPSPLPEASGTAADPTRPAAPATLPSGESAPGTAPAQAPAGIVPAPTPETAPEVPPSQTQPTETVPPPQMTPDRPAGSAPSTPPSADPSPLPPEPMPAPEAPSGTEPPKVASLPERAPGGTPPAPGESAPPAQPDEPSGEQLGMLNSQQTVLFRQPPGGAGGWQLVPVRGSVHANDLLLSPPAYRNVLLLRDFALHLRGDTLIRLGTEDDLTKILVYYGRIEILVNDAETQLIVKAGDQPPALVTFDKPASGLALECTPIREPGENPEDSAPRYQVQLFASAGEFTWDAGQPDKVYKLTAKSRYELGTPYEQPLPDDLPDWISSDEERRLIVRQSAEDLSNELQRLPNIRLDQRLEELAYDESAKVELRSLARRSLVALDRYQPAIEALRKYDRVERSTQFWPDYIDSLRKAVQRNRQSAKAVRETLSKLEGEKEGPELYRMLWGYTPQQLAAGEGDRLLGYLTHSETVFRVLAEWNLNLLLNGQARTTSTFHDSDASRIKPHVDGFRRKLGAIMPQ